MTLVSIVGDFHSSIFPIFNNFKNKMTKHILVYDNARKDTTNAKQFQKGIEKFVQKNSLNIKTEKIKVDEDSLESLKACAQAILKSSNNPSEIYINSTDGFSTLNTVLDHELFAHGVNFIAYDMYENEYNLLSKNGLEKRRVKKSLKIKDHFSLKGYTVRSSEFKEFAHKYEKEIYKLFTKHSKEYNEFLGLSPHKHPTVQDAPNSKVKKLLVEMGLQKLPKQNMLITGGLFEYYVYNLVKNLDYDDIEVGLVIEREYAASPVANEFDILIMKENHLHMIECKYLNFLKKDALVYKYIALSEIIDEDGKMIVASKEKKLKNSNDITLLPTVEKRGRLNNLYFRSDAHTDPVMFTMNVKSLFGL